MYLLVLASAACATMPFLWVDELGAADMAIPRYRIRPGDEIRVLVWRQESLSGSMLVRDDGVITVPLVGDVDIGGAYAEEAAGRIAKQLDGLVVDPKVTVQVVTTRPAMYSVVGEVRTAGAYALNAGDGVLNAIAAAGGLTDYADLDGIYVHRKEPQLKRIRFSYKKLLAGVGKGPVFFLRDGDVVVVQ